MLCAGLAVVLSSCSIQSSDGAFDIQLAEARPKLEQFYDRLTGAFGIHDPSSKLFAQAVPDLGNVVIMGKTCSLMVNGYSGEIRRFRMRRQHSNFTNMKPKPASIDWKTWINQCAPTIRQVFGMPENARWKFQNNRLGETMKFTNVLFYVGDMSIPRYHPANSAKVDFDPQTGSVIRVEQEWGLRLGPTRPEIDENTAKWLALEHYSRAYPKNGNRRPIGETKHDQTVMIKDCKVRLIYVQPNSFHYSREVNWQKVMRLAYEVSIGHDDVWIDAVSAKPIGGYGCK